LPHQKGNGRRDLARARSDAFGPTRPFIGAGEIGARFPIVEVCAFSVRKLLVVTAHHGKKPLRERRTELSI
jgi:hypothetical protein